MCPMVPSKRLDLVEWSLNIISDLEFISSVFFFMQKIIFFKSYPLLRYNPKATLVKPSPTLPALITVCPSTQNSPAPLCATMTAHWRHFQGCTMDVALYGCLSHRTTVSLEWWLMINLTYPSQCPAHSRGLSNWICRVQASLLVHSSQLQWWWRTWCAWLCTFQTHLKLLAMVAFLGPFLLCSNIIFKHSPCWLDLKNGLQRNSGDVKRTA